MATSVRIEGTTRQIVGFIVMLTLVLVSVMPSHAHNQANDHQSVSMACGSSVTTSHDHGDTPIDGHAHEQQGASDSCCVAFCLASAILPREPSLLKRVNMIHLSPTILERTSTEEASLYKPPTI